MRMVAVAVLLLATAPGHLVARQAAATELDRVKALYERALVDMLNGDTTRWMALLTTRDDVSLFTPFGGVRVGQAAVRRQYAFAASRFVAGEGGSHVEYLTTIHEGDLVYLVTLENSRARQKTQPAPGGDRTRATMIFRREDGRWRLTHRHMDHLKEEPKP